MDHFVSLPTDIMQIVMDKLHTVHLLCLMRCCKGLYQTGKNSPRWRTMRVERGLAPPKKITRKLHTDYDILQKYMKASCKSCYWRRAGVGGTCKPCRESKEYKRIEGARNGYSNQQIYVKWARESLERQVTAVQETEAHLEELKTRLHAAESRWKGVRKRNKWRQLLTA